jgi:FKBP-type peptidyl-prolyl cis-trans isomerase FkpA
MKKIRKILWVGLLATAVFSCSKDKECPAVTTAAPASEVASLDAYIQNNSISATKDDRGFYYNITAAGSGNKATVCSSVTVKYTGKLTNGTVFDNGGGNPQTFYLGQLILGWQEGIPLIKSGGKITLYLPPSLAYGSQAQPGIPANSILVFDIELQGVN